MARLRAKSVLNLHRNLSRCSELWQSQKRAPCLQSYCFSHGIAHILISGEPRRAESLLTDFDYCIARVATVEREAIRQMRDDYETTFSIGDLSEPEEFQKWDDFFRTHFHLLTRDNPDWPSWKILVQLAIEHENSSPIYTVAIKWLKYNQDALPLLQNISTHKKPSKFVLWEDEGITGIAGPIKRGKQVLLLKKNRLDNLYIDSGKVAWSVDFPFPITDVCQDDSGEKCAISIGNCSINVLSMADGEVLQACEISNQTGQLEKIRFVLGKVVCLLSDSSVVVVDPKTSVSTELLSPWVKVDDTSVCFKYDSQEIYFKDNRGEYVSWEWGVKTPEKRQHSKALQDKLTIFWKFKEIRFHGLASNKGGEAELLNKVSKQTPVTLSEISDIVTSEASFILVRSHEGLMKVIDLSGSDSGKKRPWFRHMYGEFSHGYLSDDGRTLQAWIRNPRHYDRHRWVVYNTYTGERIGRCTLKRERNIKLSNLDDQAGLQIDKRFIPIQINSNNCLELGSPIVADFIDYDHINPGLHADPEPVTSWSRRYRATASFCTVVERDIYNNEITLSTEAEHMIGSMVYAGDTLIISTAQTDVHFASRKTGKLHKIFGFSWKGTTSATLGSSAEGLVYAFHRDRFVSLSTGNLDTVLEDKSKSSMLAKLQRGEHPHELDVTLLAKVPNQPLVLSVGRAGPCVAVWSMHRGDLSKVLEDTRHKIAKVWFSNFGKYACLQTDGLLSDKEQWVWNIENSSLVARFGVREEDVFSRHANVPSFPQTLLFPSSKTENHRSFYNRQKSQFSTAILTELIGEDIEWGQVINCSPSKMPQQTSTGIEFGGAVWVNPEEITSFLKISPEAFFVGTGSGGVNLVNLVKPR